MNAGVVALSFASAGYSAQARVAAYAPHDCGPPDYSFRKSLNAMRA